MAPKLPLFVQPVTPTGAVTAPSMSMIRSLVESALDLGLRVRVIPQMHRVLGIP